MSDSIHTAWTGWPAWVRMWVLAAGIFWTGKALLCWRAKDRPQGWRLAAWAILWPGMDVRPWLNPGTCAAPGRGEWVAAVLKTATGIVLLWGLARCFASPLAAGWTGMTGLILILHFGSFHLIALYWRSRGVPVKPIMWRPLDSGSLGEFWGRRWNRAFTDLATPLIFRPVSRRLGSGIATWVVFFVSGLVHESLISLPAGGGWGLPTAYFMVQGAGVTIERRWKQPAGIPLLRAWTLTMAAAPAFWLFHPLFVFRVMNPFFHTIGAL